jgi:hypothetical protein
VVEKLQADLNLNAKVAGLVQVNAGVQVSVEKVNITIADVDVNLELVVRLGNLVNIVERVFDSLDLNPLLISLIGNVTNLVGEVIGAVDGLVSRIYPLETTPTDSIQLGSITQNGKTLNFLVDNLGNIVQEVVGAGGDALQQIVGNFKVSFPIRIKEKVRRTNALIDEHDRGYRQCEADWPRTYSDHLQVRRSWFARGHCHQCRGPGRPGCRPEAQRWKWRWKRRRCFFQHCPPVWIRDADACHAAQQGARNVQAVESLNMSTLA